MTFETARKLRGGPSLVYAHSMGNNVFRYFLEWLKLEIAPKHYTEWLDDHVHAYYAVGLFLSICLSPSLASFLQVFCLLHEGRTCVKGL